MTIIKNNILLVLLLSFLSGSFAQQAELPKELYVKVKKDEQGKLPKSFSIDKIEKDYFYGYLSGNDYLSIKDKKLEIEILTHPGENPGVAMSSSFNELKSLWDTYPTYDAYRQTMGEFNNLYQFCDSFIYGRSAENKILTGIKISTQTTNDKPSVMLSSTMHGDETPGFVLMLRLIDYLCSNYQSDARITELLNQVDIYIYPLTNPDGTYASGNNTVNGATRFNANGVDLNRNFPDAEYGPHPDGNEHQPENLYFIESSHPFTHGANLHTGAEVLNYPWDIFERRHADDLWWQHICKKYADTVFSYSEEPEYFKDVSSSGYINGYDWYTTTGSRQDFMNYFKHSKELTLEINGEKNPSADRLPILWNYHKESLLNFIEEASFGLSGLVTDSITGEPLYAEVKLLNYDKDKSEIYTDSITGFYHRVLSEGSFHVQYSAPGYMPEVNQINFNYGERLSKNITLLPLDSVKPLADFDFTNTGCNCSGTIFFNNKSYASQNTQWLWDFGTGDFSTNYSPEYTYQQTGTYTVKLFAQNNKGIDSCIAFQSINIERQIADLQDYETICTASGYYTFVSEADSCLWFNSDTILLSGNDTFNTPVLHQSEKYFLQNTYPSQPLYTGKTNPGNAVNFYTGSTEKYLVFEVFKACTLKSVKVFADGEGTRIISLKNDEGAIYSEKVFNLTEGEQRVSLNFELMPGNTYRLCAQGNCNLRYDFAGWYSSFGFPYELENILSIKYSSTTQSITDRKKFYYFFYDWVIKMPDCSTGLREVYAPINEQPTADFEAFQSNGNVFFRNTGNNANSYLWLLNQDTLSHEANLFYTFEEDGVYPIKLISKNTCGTDSVTKEITISNSGTDKTIEQTVKIKIYPNPAKEKITITAEDKITEIHIFTQTGILVKRIEAINSPNISLRLRSFSSGTYIALIYINKKVFIKKLVKL